MAVEHIKVPTGHKHTAVALFDQMDDVVQAVRELHRLGFSNENISLLARDDGLVRQVIEEVGAVNGRAIDPADALAEEVEPKGRDEMAGMAIGGTVGLLVGLGMIAIPGFGGFLLAAGPVAVAINALTTSAAGLGLGALLGAILDERVTEEHRDLYKQRLERGGWLLVAHGESENIERAAEVLRERHSDHVDAF